MYVLTYCKFLMSDFSKSKQKGIGDGYCTSHKIFGKGEHINHICTNIFSSSGFGIFNTV